MAQFQDYEDLLRVFNDGRVRYLLVGALAVSHYAQPRYTKDMDIWIEPARLNADRVYGCLAKYGAPMVSVTQADFTVKGTVFQIGVEPVRIDIITDIAGVKFPDAWRRRKRIPFGSTWCNVLSLDDLLRAKRASNRAQDKLDIVQLMAVRRKR